MGRTYPLLTLTNLLAFVYTCSHFHLRVYLFSVSLGVHVLTHTCVYTCPLTCMHAYPQPELVVGPMPDLEGEDGIEKGQRHPCNLTCM